MKKRMIKKNLKKNRDKNRRKTKNIVVADVQAPQAEPQNPAIHVPVSAGLQRVQLAVSTNPRVPASAQVLKEHGGWVLHLSQNDHSIYLETTDYHADPLRLTKETLHDLISLIERID